VLLISFWATWCEPCREELQGLAELAKKFGPGELRIMLVPVEDEVSRVKEFLKSSRVDLPVFESLRAKEHFAAAVIPTNVIIDNSGRLRYRKVGSDGFEDMREFELVVRKLIREKSSDR
jgi:thiol-disulfide isomerase/thioredoxin